MLMITKIARQGMCAGCSIQGGTETTLKNSVVCVVVRTRTQPSCRSTHMTSFLFVLPECDSLICRVLGVSRWNCSKMAGVCLHVPPPPAPSSSVCVRWCTEWGRRVVGRGGERQHCSADRWMQWPGLSQQHVPSRLRLYNSLRSASLPTASKAEGSTSRRQGAHENSEHMHTRVKSKSAAEDGSVTFCHTCCNCLNRASCRPLLLPF